VQTAAGALPDRTLLLLVFLQLLLCYLNTVSKRMWGVEGSQGIKKLAHEIVLKCMEYLCPPPAAAILHATARLLARERYAVLLERSCIAKARQAGQTQFAPGHARSHWITYQGTLTTCGPEPASSASYELLIPASWSGLLISPSLSSVPGPQQKSSLELRWQGTEIDAALLSETSIWACALQGNVLEHTGC
jgi:hypothetical protein